MNADTIGKLCGAVGVIAGLAAAWGTATYMFGGGAGSLPAGRYPVVLLIIIFVGPPIAVGLAVGFGVTFVLALGVRAAHESRRRLDPSYEADILRRRGQTDATLGSHDRSIASYSEAIRLKPNDAHAYYLRAQAHEAKNDWDKAKADYDEAIRIDPNYVVAYIDRGALAFNKLNDTYGAIADSRRALQLAPDNKTVSSNLDIIYRSKKADDATLAALTEAIKRNPQDTQALTQRGRAYCIRGDDARALPDLNEALRLSPEDTTALVNRGGILTRKREWEAALADYTALTRLAPDFALGHFNLGVICENLGRRADAIAGYRKALELVPGDVDAANSLKRLGVS